MPIDYKIKPNYTYVDTDFSFYDYQIYTTVTQTWSLTAGWNWVGMSVQMSGAADVSTLLNSHAFDTGDVILTSKYGSVQYFPAQTGWTGGFYPPQTADSIILNLGQDCKIKVAKSHSIELTGDMPETHEFKFPVGWFWSSLPISENLPVNDFLPGIWGQGDVLLSSTEGSVQYFPAQTGWTGGWYPPTAQLTHFKPGILYKFKRATAVNATFTL